MGGLHRGANGPASPKGGDRCWGRRRSADWKFHNDRHYPGPERQLRSGALPARCVPPKDQTPQTPPPPRSQLESPRRLRALGGRPSGTGPTPRTGLRRGSSRDATGPRGGGGRNGRPSESVSGRNPATPSASPLGHGPTGIRPTHPAGSRVGRGAERAYSSRPCSYPSFRLAL
nr:collagen alpha-2(I) chain-like [Gorilla gorilla gorilla]